MDINLGFAAPRSLELGPYFKSPWRLPIFMMRGRRRRQIAKVISGGKPHHSTPGSQSEGSFSLGESLQITFDFSLASDLLLKYPIIHMAPSSGKEF